MKVGNVRFGRWGRLGGEEFLEGDNEGVIGLWGVEGGRVLRGVDSQGPGGLRRIGGEDEVE